MSQKDPNWLFRILVLRALLYIVIHVSVVHTDMEADLAEGIRQLEAALKEDLLNNPRRI